MKKKNTIRKTAFLMSAAVLLCMSTGCSRAAINYQIAESIGTVGKYENNQPVETPQMKEERILEEQLESEQEDLQEQLDQVAALASQYYYEEAIEQLNQMEKTDATQDSIDAVLAEYQAVVDSLTPYTGNVPHLCFPTLIADTSLAFDSDTMSSTYADSMITVKEFENILNSLYINDYVLVDITDVVKETTDSRGVTMMERQELLLPPGKTPLIISQDNLNYYGIQNGDGIATRLELDDAGDVKAVYMDSEGHDLRGDYDLIPVLETFLQEHPDFAYHGAKGIVSVSGSEGMFGYDTEESVFTQEAGKRDTARKIAQVLIQNGWKIACAGYNHNNYMNEMSLETLQSEITSWKDEIGSLSGDTNILFYPYGGEVEYPSEQLDYLLESGFQYLCGLCSDEDILQIDEGYVRQTRRFVDGYSLLNASQYFNNFFAVSAVLDEDR